MEYWRCSISRLGVQVSHIRSFPDLTYSASEVKLPLPASAQGQHWNGKKKFGTTGGIGLFCTVERSHAILAYLHND